MNFELRYSKNEIINYIAYIVLGLIITYFSVFLARDKQGWGIFIIILIIIYIKNKDASLFILYNIILL